MRPSRSQLWLNFTWDSQKCEPKLVLKKILPQQRTFEIPVWASTIPQEEFCREILMLLWKSSGEYRHPSISSPTFSRHQSVAATIKKF
jgi:hypothetical protein